jgi:5'-deoxynucleotidase YfbR-like HD superfamily hydrolase
MSQIFLSHSRKDRQVVQRLENDLRAAGFEVWMDSSEISVGQSISKKIQEGLKESEYLGIWLTVNSVGAGWVEQEWLAKLHLEIHDRQVMVLPLLAEDIEIPLLLRDKKYADFRTDYNSGLNQLLSVLRSGVAEEERTIAGYAREFLEDLGGTHIPLPLHGSIDIIGTLKKLPRSGKKIRLETYSPEIQIRSIYDHILSVAHSADSLFSAVRHGVRHGEKAELARCIAYHDVPEILLGDLPGYTNLTDAKRNRARVFAERRLSELPSGEPERIANEFIRMFLNDRERKSLSAAMQTLSDERSPVRRFFYVLDKMDPIIAVWRYLHLFRGQLDPGATEFLKRLKDFFDNPRVKEVAKDYTEDPVVQELVLTLQDRRLARNYYRDADAIPGKLAGINRDILKTLIEGTDLLFAQ